MSTATFAGVAGGLTVPSSFVEVVRKNLPGNTSWAVTAIVTTRAIGQTDAETRDLDCELRSSGGFIGSASDRRFIPSRADIRRSVTLNGGAFIPAEGGNVSLFCRSSATSETLEAAQIMLIQVDGFS